MKVYVITSSTRVCYGHGDYGSEVTLASKEAYKCLPHPAFASKELAENYLKGIDKYGRLTLMELELVEDL